MDFHAAIFPGVTCTFVLIGNGRRENLSFYSPSNNVDRFRGMWRSTHAFRNHSYLRNEQYLVWPAGHTRIRHVAHHRQQGNSREQPRSIGDFGKFPIISENTTFHFNLAPRDPRCHVLGEPSAESMPQALHGEFLCAVDLASLRPYVCKEE